MVTLEEKHWAILINLNSSTNCSGLQDKSFYRSRYVQPFPGPGPKIQISSEGGTDPMWQRLGKEIYYRSGDKMMVVEVRSLSPFSSRILYEGYAGWPPASCKALLRFRK